LSHEPEWAHQLLRGPRWHPLIVAEIAEKPFLLVVVKLFWLGQPPEPIILVLNLALHFCHKVAATFLK
jgi:hypothetical protein